MRRARGIRYAETESLKIYFRSQPGFLNRSRAGGREVPRSSRNFLVRFWQDEIVAADKVEGNLSVVWGSTVFVAGIFFAKTIAKDTIVPFF